MIKLIIKKMRLDDYFFVVDKKSEYNTTGEIELYTLNSETWVTKGTISTIKYILDYKFN